MALKSVVTLVLAALLLLYLGPVGYAQQTPTVALIDILPFGKQNTDGRLSGFYYDLGRLIEQEAGVKFNYNLLSPPRAARSFAAGEVDFVITGANSKPYQMGASLGILGCHFVGIATRSDSGITGIDTLDGKKIGMITGGYIAKKYSGKFGIEPVASTTAQSLIAMLYRGRVQGIFLTDILFLSHVRDHRGKDYVPFDWQVKTGPFIPTEKFEVDLKISEKSPFVGLNNRLRDAIRKIRGSGLVAKTYQKYAPELEGSCK